MWHGRDRLSEDRPSSQKDKGHRTPLPGGASRASLHLGLRLSFPEPSVSQVIDKAVLWAFHATSGDPTEGQPSGRGASSPGSPADRPSNPHLTRATDHQRGSFRPACRCSSHAQRSSSSLDPRSSSSRPVHLPQVTSDDTLKFAETTPMHSSGGTEGGEGEADTPPHTQTHTHTRKETASLQHTTCKASLHHGAFVGRKSHLTERERESRSC